MSNPPWADEVLRLREAFYLKQVRMEEEIRAAIDIAGLFGPRWRLPIAANLLALRPRLSEDRVILEGFRTMPFTGRLGGFLQFSLIPFRPCVLVPNRAKRKKICLRQGHAVTFSLATPAEIE